MPTECIPDLFGFARVEARAAVAAFDGSAVTSDARGCCSAQRSHDPVFAVLAGKLEAGRAACAPVRWQARAR